MKKVKFSYSDLLILIGAFLFGWNCFFGFYFSTLGNLGQSITYSLLISCVLIVLAFSLANQKRVDRKFKTNLMVEMVLLFCFCVFSLFFALRPFTHKFVVSTRKVEIQQKLNNSIDSLSKLFPSYEDYAKNRIDIYKHELQSVVNARQLNSQYQKYGFIKGRPDSSQIKTKIFILQTKLLPSNFEEMKRIESEWYDKAKNAIDVWREKSVVDISNKVGENGNQSIDSLKKLGGYKAPNENPGDFDFNSPNASINHLFTQRGSPPFQSLIYAALIYLLLLSSYLISRRSTKLTSLKDLFISQTTDNELLSKRKNNEL